jgi:hypothetical protein
MAALALVGGGLLFAVTLTGALRLDPLPSPEPVVADAGARTEVSRPFYVAARMAAAVDKDPFHPERRRPDQPFRLPDEGAPPPGAPAEIVGPRLIGTGVAPGGGFAICQLPGGPARLIHVGEKLGNLTLHSVEPGRATFTTASGDSVVVRVPRTGS